MSGKGLFIVIEGIDGSGKTTQLNSLSTKLQDKGYQICITQEPTKTALGDMLRKYLSNPDSIPYADALLFAADRVEHYFDVILPNLEQGKMVLCDRYKTSSLVYQGAQGVPVDWIREINSKSLDPDYAFYLDVDVDIAMKRINEGSRKNLEKFENIEYLKKIMNNYISLKEDWWYIIDGNRNAESVTNDIFDIVCEKLSPQ